MSLNSNSDHKVISHVTAYRRPQPLQSVLIICCVSLSLSLAAKQYPPSLKITLHAWADSSQQIVDNNKEYISVILVAPTFLKCRIKWLPFDNFEFPATTNRYIEQRKQPHKAKSKSKILCNYQLSAIISFSRLLFRASKCPITQSLNS